jgi:hypothetical protein
MGKGLLTLAVALLIAAVAPGLATAKPKKQKHKPKPQPVSLSIQSSRADMVSGGNALIAVDVPKPDPIGNVRVRRNGVDVTSSFNPDAQNPRRLLGVVQGMRNGSNRISALVKGKGQRGPAELNLFNSPISGPIFSGPHQQPYFCTTVSNGLGSPTDADCSAPTAVEYRYRSTGGSFKPLADPTSRPADLAQTTTRTGQTVDYVVRIESGVINRAVYRFAVLAAGGQTGNGWNGRLVYGFGGGCSAGHQQGNAGTGLVLDDRDLSRGYAVASSSLNVFETACNDVLSAETASMVKEHVIETLGRAPVWTIGEGGSGGSIQAQMIAQNYPGILDGLLPAASFPDNSQPSAPDCRLLTNYYATAPGSSLSTAQREAIEGFVDAGTCDSLTHTADVIDAQEGCDAAVPNSVVFDPVTNPGGVRCSLWDTMINVYGTNPATGKARRTFDNVGVQYGLGALRHGDVSMDEFLDLNEGVGGYDDDGTIVPQRSVADPEGLAIAYRTGRIDQGVGGLPSVPIIDARDYADDEANVHQYINTYVTRARLRRANGTSANQVMFRATGAGVNPMQDTAIDLMGAWLDAIHADASSRPLPQKVIADKPGSAVDACWTTGGTRIDEPAEIGGSGPCQTLYPPHQLPRMVAGLPIDSLVAKCQLHPVNDADYPGATPTQLTRLHQIFPGGVCDYSKPGAEEQAVAGTWQSFGPPQTIEPRSRKLSLRARLVLTRKGQREKLMARLRPCPEVTWQRVTFERRRGKRLRPIKSVIVDGGKCTATLQTKPYKGLTAYAKPIAGYAQARAKRG